MVVQQIETVTQKVETVTRHGFNLECCKNPWFVNVFEDLKP